MWLPGTMALYSSSPPGVWSAQCTLSANSASVTDMDLLSRSSHNSTSKPLVLGGLSSLFSSPTARHSTCSVSDTLEPPCLSCVSGMARSSSQTDLPAFSAGGLRDPADARNGALGMPISSLKLKDRSPVTVLHGPAASVATSHGSQMFSLASWDSAGGTSAVPSLDPLVDRVSGRRRSSLSGESKLPVPRSEGFEVRGDRLAAAFRSRVLDLRRSDTEVSSSDSEVSDDGEELELEGLLADYLPTSAVALDSVTSRFVAPEVKIANLVRGHADDVLASRDRIWVPAERDAGLLSTHTQGFTVASQHVTANDMLSNAQAQHEIFKNALVVRAFEAARLAHQGQVSPHYCLAASRSSPFAVWASGCLTVVSSPLQFRKSGDLYLSHCVETARILASTGADSTVVAAGLLHDTLDDSSFTEGQLRTDFGDEVADLVRGVCRPRPVALTLYSGLIFWALVGGN